jgi:hypothetical protein
MENTDSNGEVNWQIPTLIFAKTLSIILEENQGIVINLDDHMRITGHEDVKQVMVYKKNGEINIAPSEDEFEEGSALNLNITE